MGNLPLVKSGRGGERGGGGRRVSAKAARQTRPQVNHAAAAGAAAEAAGRVFWRRIVLGQIRIREQLKSPAAEPMVGGDAADGANGQVQLAGDVRVSGARAKGAADGAQLVVGESHAGSSFKVQGSTFKVVRVGEGERGRQRDGVTEGGFG
jgi:hypothetical protein